MFRIKPLDSGPIEKAGRKPQKKHRDLDYDHLAFIRSLPCAASLSRIGVIAHHVRIGLFRGARKPSDSVTVPLRADLHTGGPNALHEFGEAKFWNALGIDAHDLAARLWEHSGDYQRCVAEVEAARAAGKVRRRFGIEIYSGKELLSNEQHSY